MRKTKVIEETEGAFTLTHNQIKARYNLGSYTIEKIAKEAKAIIKIGNRKLYIVNKMDKYLEENAVA